SVKAFLPFIEDDDLEPEMAGIRPKLQGPGDDFRDFVIRHEQDKGLPGFINLIGIESPGLTSAPAIAKHVEGVVNQIL
ncbi:MAG: FAD-dependent oxidoreductase, partial [Dehalococcoidia bacterium]|nr:FAD-dependent oxidoreductase [Dehalococcoidia bacterium]